MWRWCDTYTCWHFFLWLFLCIKIARHSFFLPHLCSAHSCCGLCLFFLSPIFVTLKISLLLYLVECWCVLILFSWHKCQHCFLGNKRRHFLQCYRYNCYLLNCFADYEIEVFVLISGLLIVVDRCMKPLNCGRQLLPWEGPASPIKYAIEVIHQSLQHQLSIFSSMLRFFMLLW